MPLDDEKIQILKQFYVICMLTILQRPSIRLLKHLNFSVCKQVLLKGGFQHQKWESNNVDLQKNIREKETNNSSSSSNQSTDDVTYAQYQFRLNDPQFRKVLGMNWDIVRDKFQFSYNKICKFALKLTFKK